MLTQLPPTIYRDLIPSHSIFHPTNRAPALVYKSSKPVDLSISQESDQTGDVKWYEQIDLTHLNISSNEINILEDEVGGFESLEHCDVSHHCHRHALVLLQQS